MNAATLAFVDELRTRPDVVGVVMFGSRARGDHRPDSDVDLVVFCTTGFHRGVEHRHGQAFEIIWTTESAAYDYYVANRDDATALWAVAQILHDPHGAIGRLAARVRSVLADGKAPLSPAAVAHARFDAEDVLRHVAGIVERDPATAQFLLAGKVIALTALYFDLHGVWTPPPKQRLAQLPPAIAELVRTFFAERTPSHQLVLAGQLVLAVFGADRPVAPGTGV